jgi:predicted transcriptional regulator
MKRLLLFVFFLQIVKLPAVTWSWEWTAVPGDDAVKAEVTTFRYGKEWAYAVELDDGPNWVRPFAMPFLAKYEWTDAPPGVAGGTKKPFVGGIAVIVAAVQANDSSVTWDDLNFIRRGGWGVLNHSLTHSYVHWDPKPESKITEAQAREDAYWGQCLLAIKSETGRAPTAAVYANGTVDYNKNGALSDMGIGLATRVGASGTMDVKSPKLNLMDFPRNFLDEGPWKEGGKGDPLHGIPNAKADGPKTDSFVIDFTHNIDRNEGSENQKRWTERLNTIATKWGAAGKDNVWVAPTDAVGDYLRAAKAATVTVTAGKLNVTIPDELPGTALTLKLSGVKAQGLKAPEGGALYQKDDTVWLTTPMMGIPGAMMPKLVCVYEGKPSSLTFDRPIKVAGVGISFLGQVETGTTFPLSLVTADGNKDLPVEPFGGKWMSGLRLYPVAPASEPLLATGLIIESRKGMSKLLVWALDDEQPRPTVTVR